MYNAVLERRGEREREEKLCERECVRGKGEDDDKRREEEENSRRKVRLCTGARGGKEEEGGRRQEAEFGGHRDVMAKRGKGKGRGRRSDGGGGTGEKVEQLHPAEGYVHFGEGGEGGDLVARRATLNAIHGATRRRRALLTLEVVLEAVEAGRGVGVKVLCEACKG
jgi:hypothetical protein